VRALEAGTSGLLPKEMTVRIDPSEVARYQASRRISRMNMRLEKEFSQHITEQRGWHWALAGLYFTKKEDAELLTAKIEQRI